MRLAQRFPEPMQIATVVMVDEKAGLTVMAALNDVQRNAIEVNAWPARHDPSDSMCAVRRTHAAKVTRTDPQALQIPTDSAWRLFSLLEWPQPLRHSARQVPLQAQHPAQ